MRVHFLVKFCKKEWGTDSDSEKGADIYTDL